MTVSEVRVLLGAEIREAQQALASAQSAMTEVARAATEMGAAVDAAETRSVAALELTKAEYQAGAAVVKAHQAAVTEAEALIASAREEGAAVATAALKEEEAAQEAATIASQKAATAAEAQRTAVVGMAGGIAAGLALAATGAVTMASHFDSAMLDVVNNTTMSKREADEMREAVLKLGAESGAPMDALAKGWMHAANEGFHGAEAMQVATAGMQAAVSTGANAEHTINALAVTLKEFSLHGGDAARVMNALHLAAASGNMTLAEYDKAMGKAFAMGAQLGVGIGDLNAAFSTFTQHGFNASQAATQITGILSHIAAPSKAAQQALEALSKTSGVDLVGDFTAAGLKAKGVMGIMVDLDKATHGHTDTIISKLIPALRGGVGAMTLAGTALSDLKKHEEEQAQALSGKLTPITEGYNARLQTLGNEFARLKNRIEADMIPAGEKLMPIFERMIPRLEKFADVVIRLLDNFSKWPPALQDITVGLGGLFMVEKLIAPMGALFKLLTGITGVAPALARIGAGLAGSGGAFAAGGGALGTAATGASAVGAAVPLLAGSAMAFQVGRGIREQFTGEDQLQGQQDLRTQQATIQAAQWKAAADMQVQDRLSMGTAKYDESGKLVKANPADVTNQSLQNAISQMQGQGDLAKQQAVDKQTAAITDEIAKAQARLNEAMSGGDKISEKIAGSYRLVTQALRDKLVHLNESIIAEQKQQAAQKDAETTLAGLRGKVDDLKVALSGHADGIQGLIAKHKGWTDAQYQTAAGLLAQEVRLKEQVTGHRTYESALGSTDQKIRDLKAALDGQGASYVKLHANIQGVSTAEMANLHAHEQQLAALEKLKKAQDEQNRVQVRFNTALGEAKGKLAQLLGGDGLEKLAAEFKGLIPDDQLRKLEQVNEQIKKAEVVKTLTADLKELRGQIATTSSEFDLNNVAAKLTKQTFAELSPEAQKLVRQYAELAKAQQPDLVKKVREEILSTRREMQLSVNPFDLYRVAVQATGKAFHDLGTQAQAAVRQLAAVRQEAAQLNALRQATQNVALAGAQLRFDQTRAPMALLRAQNPGFDDATLRQMLALQQQQQGLQGAAQVYQQGHSGTTTGIQQQFGQFSGMGTVQTPADLELQRLLETLKNLNEGMGTPTTPGEQAARQGIYEQTFDPRQRQLLAGVTGDPNAYFGQQGQGQGKAGPADAMQKAIVQLFNPEEEQKKKAFAAFGKAITGLFNPEEEGRKKAFDGFDKRIVSLLNPEEEQKKAAFGAFDKRVVSLFSPEEELKKAAFTAFNAKVAESFSPDETAKKAAFTSLQAKVTETFSPDTYKGALGALQGAIAQAIAGAQAGAAMASQAAQAVAATAGPAAVASSLAAGSANWEGVTTEARAGGGAVSSGQPYVVGERGPELFVPSSSGSIVPNGGAGNVTVNMTVVTNDAQSFRQSRQQVQQDLHRTIRYATGRNQGG